MTIHAFIAILALPLLVPMAFLFLLKGAHGLRTGCFALYSAYYEGLSGRIAGLLSMALASLLLGFCMLLAAKALGFMPGL